MNFSKFILLFFAARLFVHCGQPEPNMVDLYGQWQLKLDPSNQGIDNQWFNQAFPDTINLPGCLQEQGLGEKPGPETKWWAPLDLSERHPSLAKYSKADEHFKLVQYLMPRHHYIGAAWFAREVEIPKSFSGKQIALRLERCHWESQVWVDGIKIGSNRSLATPHVYDLSQFKPGKHRLSIRIDNSKIVDLGGMAHSVSDQTQGTWNGIVGELSLTASDAVFIKKVRAYPDIHHKIVRLKIEIANPEKLEGECKIAIDAKGINDGNLHNPDKFVEKVQLRAEAFQILDVNYQMGEGTVLWDEFAPNLYQLQVDIRGNGFDGSYSSTFGMREFRADGNHFTINGTKTFLRGNVDCAVNPQTGYAPMSVERWKEIFQVYKDYGLNHVRFHSWCPPKQAFVAADEIGLYLAPEVHEWTWVKEGKVADFLKEESVKMLEEFSNHPSFVMMGLGNESGIEEKLAQEFIDQWKQADSSRLYTIKASDASHQGFPENMAYEILGHVRDQQVDRGRIRTRYQAFWPPTPGNSDLVCMKPQTNIDWREGIKLYQKKYKKRPLIAHETAQFCAYPDVFNELKKYTGYLRPTYLEIAADQLEERGMAEQLPDFVANSGKWQVLLTREEIEASLRTPGYAGFQWLGLNDFTGQNTAPVGFTDAFYEPKSYVDSETVKRFCAPTVLLARLPKRVFASNEELAVDFEVSYFGKNNLDLDDFTVVVKNDQGEAIKKEVINGGVFGQGNVQELGSLAMNLSFVKEPAKFNLEISSPQNRLANDYDFWVYPEMEVVAFPKGIIVSDQWDNKTQSALTNGKTVLLLPKAGTLKGNLPGCFTTFYWTSFGEEGGQSSACGITLNNQHPLFNNFPTENHANWQWWELLTRCQPMILDQFEEKSPWPKDYRPLVQPIDSWKLNRKLGLVVEAKIGKGKLLICSIDIESSLDTCPVAKQFRKSVVDYLQSPEFNPQTEVQPAAVSALFDQSKAGAKTSLQGLPTEG